MTQTATVKNNETCMYLYLVVVGVNVLPRTTYITSKEARL